MAISDDDRLYRRMLAMSPFAMWVCDADTLRFLAVNDAAVRQYGYSQAEFLEKSLTDIHPDEDRESVRGLFEPWHLAAHRGACWRHVTKQGTVIIVEAHVESVTFAGRPARLDFIQDISDVQHAVRAMGRHQRADQRYRGLFDHVDEGVYQASPDGRYLFANAALARMFGYESVDALLQTNAGELYRNEDAAHPEPFVAPREGDDAVRNLERRLKRRDGQAITVLESCRVVRGDNGEILYHQAVLTDLTERKGLEAQFRQSQKMEAVGRLAGGVAHDFNNILTAIMGYVELGIDDTSDPASVREDLQEIQQLACRAAALTHQLLAFSRQQKLEPRRLNLTDVVSHVQKMLQRLIGEDIALVGPLENGRPDVTADRSQLEQVIMNLAVNARDAMPQGGTLRIETLTHAVDETFAATHQPMPPGEYVVLRVKDTGAGIEPQVLPHIFEPFFTTKQRGEGTGLGLSIVYGIVKQSGGYIWVETAPQEGTAFAIYLPVAAPPDPALESPPDASPIAPREAHETVLILEDDENVRLLVGMVLQRAGYAVLLAADGAEVDRIAAQHLLPIHLVIADVVMPVENGITIAGRLRRQRGEVKVLYMSGYTQTDVLRQLHVDEPLHCFLRKPFTPAELLDAVRLALAT